jgi:uncharacterized membrane protein
MNVQPLKLFAVALFVFILTDIIWLGFIAKNLYFEQYAQWLRLEDNKLKPIWWAVLMVYFFLALGIVAFIIPLAKASLLYSAFYGALFGAIIYGVYNFTCLAIFKDFPLAICFIDWIWGVILCSWSSFVTNYIVKNLI